MKQRPASSLFAGFLLLFCFCAAAVTANVHKQSSPLEYTISLKEATTVPFPHFWEKSVGSCHAATALRADYQNYLKIAHEELGFQYVRFHGVLNDDMSVYMPSLNPPYSFFNVDSVFDFLTSINMRPIVELSFMPEGLASGNQTCFHYKGNVTPPKDWNEWYKLIYAFGAHMLARYGLEEVKQWYFEVWNEPNLGYFWAGSQVEYFQLYNVTARALKAVHPALRVGGPATAGSGWIPEFMEYVTKNNVPVDFVSTHEYPTDIQPVDRNNMKYIVTKTKGIIGPKLPLLYTEFNAGLNEYGGGSTFYQDSSYPAPFLVKTFNDVQGLVDAMSYWTVSDIFEEGGQNNLPFQGQFGLMTVHGVRKPAYRALQLLHAAGDEKLVIVAPPAANQSTIEVVPVLNRQTAELMIFVANVDVPTKAQVSYNVKLTMKGMTSGSQAKMYVIDQDRTNPLAFWQNQLGKVAYPTKSQIQQMHQSSELAEQVVQCVTSSSVENDCAFQVSAAPYSLSVIKISLQ